MESNLKEHKKRPGWVWVISVFFSFSAAYTLFSFYLIYSGKIPLQPAQKAYFESLTVIDHGLTILLGLTNLIGAVLFFCLRKQAFYFFSASLAFNILMTVWHVITKGFVAAIGGAGLIGMLIGWGILVAVCIYAKRLKSSGILN